MNIANVLLGKKKYRFILYNFELGLLMLCCFFSSERASGIVACSVFLVYVILIPFGSPRVVLKYLFFYFMMIANVMGCFVCEYGDFYLTELSVYSHYVGALPTLVLAQWVLFTSIYELEMRFQKNNRRRGRSYRINENTMVILNAFVFAIYVLIFIHVYPYSAIRLNVDRMTFANLGYNTGLWGFLSKWAQFFIPIPIGCITYSKRKAYKAFGILTLVIYCLYYLWIGNKFGTFFSLFCVFCLLMFSKFHIKERILKKLLIGIILSMAILILCAAYIFTKLQGQGNAIGQYLQNRLAQQGQLFWRTYEVSAGNIHLSDIGAELTGQLMKTNEAQDLVGARFGVYNIMYLCAPKSKVDGFILYGSRYTEAGYASAFYYLGIFGPVLFALFIARVAVFISNGLVDSTQKNSLFGMILMVRMYLILCTTWGLFLFRDFLTGTSIITYMWLLFFSRYRMISLRIGQMKISPSLTHNLHWQHEKYTPKSER